ncbi:MAG: AmmeMemoRadiSam system protein A [Woeseiaceae bacterium]|nr:AmmeMemoRadiSam system protein A [Woeseiaceae bacterium]
MHSPERQDLVGTELLRLARGSIEHGLAHSEPLPVRCDQLPAPLTEPRATFTTLRLAGELRGCCGALEAIRPLAEDVAHSSFQAAFRDPRFTPVGEHELAALALEVAVLSPMEPMTVSDEQDLLEQLRPGTDGLVIVAGTKRATFLPKVWESLPRASEFLAALKTKCGLPADYWSGQLEFRRYRTTSFADVAPRP